MRQLLISTYLRRGWRVLAASIMGLFIPICLLMPQSALAANPPQCTAGSGVYDCTLKNDSYPADANNGSFLADHCYVLRDSGFGRVYFDTPCTQSPFSAGVAGGAGVVSSNSECQPKGSLFGFPTWYKYMKGDYEYLDYDGKVLNPASADAASPNVIRVCSPHLNGLNDVWLIVAAVIEILLRLAALAAIAMVVWGGIQYIMSQGEPDRTTKARNTIVNALIGLVISVGAATFVSFVAGRFK